MGHALEESEWNAWVAEGDPRAQRAYEEIKHWHDQFQEMERHALSGHDKVKVALKEAFDAHKVNVALHRAMSARDMLGHFRAAHGLHDKLEDDGETVTKAKALPKGPAAKAHEAMEAHCETLDRQTREEEQLFQIKTRSVPVN